MHDGIILIHRNALRLLKLINDLLDLTRLDQGAEIYANGRSPPRRLSRESLIP